MNRLQKKCIIASTGMHGLLVLILFVGPAFFTNKKVDAPVIIELVDGMKVTDGASRPKGNPSVTQPPAAQAAAPQPTPPQQPVRQPDPPKQEVKQVEKIPDPPKPREEVKIKEPPVEVKKEVKPQKLTLTPVTKTPEKNSTPQKLVLTPVTRPAPSKEQVKQNTAAEKQAQQWQAIAKTVGTSRKTIVSNVSASTSVEVAGDNFEGAINYSALVRAKYEQAWIDPEEVSDEKANVKVQITIDRSGDVASARVMGRSGIPALDRSVERALDRVQFVAPFPDGAKERQRTFIINFNLKAKRSFG